MFIPSLRHVAISPCAILPAEIRDSHLAGEEIFIDEPPSLIPIHGKASLQAEEKSGSISGKTQLTFHTTLPIDIREPLAFFAYTHEGRILLLGAWEPPFPEITQTADTGETPSSQRSITITAKWSSLPIPVTFLSDD